MKTSLKVLACSSFIFGLAVAAEAKDWRGITPLQSTRLDVERLLGKPPAPDPAIRQDSPNMTSSIYFLEEGEVHVVFAETDVPAALDCLRKIPVGTVLMIQVKPKKDWTLSDLQLDEKKLRKFNPSKPQEIGYEGYIDENEGVVIRTFTGRVEQINYVAKAQDTHLCPSYYEKPEAFVELFICGLAFIRKFDEYGDIDFNDEKARLDNIAIELKNDPGTQLNIIGYAGRMARPGEALTKANRAKHYLDFERRLEAGRVVALDGGHREELILEFWIVPLGAQPPVSSPTVDPSEVDIIYDDVKQPRQRAKP